MTPDVLKVTLTFAAAGFEQTLGGISCQSSNLYFLFTYINVKCCNIPSEILRS